MGEGAGLFLRDFGVGLAVLILEVVVLAAGGGGGGGGDVEDLSFLGGKGVSRLRGAFGDNRCGAFHQVRAGINVVVAAEHQIDASFRQLRSQFLAESFDVVVKVARALGERCLVDADDDPISPLAHKCKFALRMFYTCALLVVSA